jgi:glycosyltransferase involved in cell wall biosynthesis
METRVLDRLHGELRGRVRRIAESVDPEVFDPAPAKDAHARPILVYRGELEERDGWSAFLEIGALVSIRVPDLELWLLGGSEAPEEITLAMMETAESLGVLKTTRWFPALDSAAAARALAYAGRSGGATILTRRFETSGQVALEALLAGCPVISAIPSAAVEVAGEHIATFREDHFDEAEAAVLELLHDASRRLRRSLLADRARFVAFASPEITGGDYLAVVRGLLERE